MKKKLLNLLQQISYAFEDFQETLESDSGFWRAWSEMQEALEKVDIPEKIYIVFEYADYGNKIVGAFKNRKDAEDAHAEDPTPRYIEEVNVR